MVWRKWFYLTASIEEWKQKKEEASCDRPAAARYRSDLILLRNLREPASGPGFGSSDQIL